jgi:hypothetical protein
VQIGYEKQRDGDQRVVYKVLVCSYIFISVPDGGFVNKPKTRSTFWPVKVWSENTVVIDGPFGGK